MGETTGPGSAPPQWRRSRRWLVLAGVVGPALFAVLLGAGCALLARDPLFGLSYFFVVLLVWVLPRALVWSLTIVGTVLEHEDHVLSVLDRRGDVRPTVDLRAVRAVARIEVARADLVPFARHDLSTAVQVVDVTHAQAPRDAATPAAVTG